MSKVIQFLLNSTNVEKNFTPLFLRQSPVLLYTYPKTNSWETKQESQQASLLICTQCFKLQSKISQQAFVTKNIMIIIPQFGNNQDHQDCIIKVKYMYIVLLNLILNHDDCYIYKYILVYVYNMIYCRQRNFLNLSSSSAKYRNIFIIAYFFFFSMM